MKNKAIAIYLPIMICIGIYLFVSAPPALPDSDREGKTVSIEAVLEMMANENDIVRELYTKEIVGKGIKAGLKFDENWRDNGVEAGPLPALFLRETAMSLEKSPVRLGLFLGSDFPISPANRFDGTQMERFEVIKETLAPQFFYAEDTGLYTAMFADKAIAEACVSCHNEHEESPKKDWALNDIMGATTWSYPKASVTLDELTAILKELRNSFGNAYGAYIAKAENFSRKPEIGSNWPKDGYYLPSKQVFMD